MQERQTPLLMHWTYIFLALNHGNEDPSLHVWTHDWECNLNNNAFINTLRLRQNGRHFTDNIFKCISLNENIWILIYISLNFVPKGQINNIPSLVQIMAWCLSGNKPLSEPMMVSYWSIYGYVHLICMTVIPILYYNSHYKKYNHMAVLFL